jgi:endoglucanase
MFLYPWANPGSAWPLILCCFGAAMLPGCDAPTDAPIGSPASSEAGAPVVASGCPVTPSSPVAPHGYYVSGNTVCTADGRPHLLHGVDRPSLEWGPGGEHINSDDFQLMASWGANVVRVALNQDFWLADSPLYAANYASLVDHVVALAEAAGMDVILDLHWSDRGTLGSCTNSGSKGCQQLMADPNSVQFWTEVAARYGQDGRVAFELYNEPHDVSWEIWLHGGTTSQGWQAVGMQDLYDAVRATGANNLVIAGGLDFAYDLTGVPSHLIDGYNVLYATHPYNNAPQRMPPNWEHSWGFLAQTQAVIATEFGDTSPQCASDFNQQLIAFADSHHASWTAWAWFPSGCSFPSIIADWQGTPSVQGEPVKAALLGYQDPASNAGGADAGADADGNDGGLPGDAGSTEDAAGTADPVDAGRD